MEWMEGNGVCVCTQHCVAVVCTDSMCAQGGQKVLLRRANNPSNRCAILVMQTVVCQTCMGNIVEAHCYGFI